MALPALASALPAGSLFASRDASRLARAARAPPVLWSPDSPAL